MTGTCAVPRAARVRFKPRAAAVFGAGYTLTPPQKKSGGVMFMGRLLSGYEI